MKIIIGKSAGFCYGVKRAVESSEKFVNANIDKVTYCFGELVHNKQVIQNLKNKGIRFIEKLDEIVEQNCNLIIRAHGVPKQIYDQVKLRNIKLEDYTCPNVLKIHRIVDQYRKDGYYIFLTGNLKHPETQGILSHCDNTYSVIEKEEDVEQAIQNFEKSKNSKLLLVSQTTYSLQKFDSIIGSIKEKIKKDKKFVIEYTICLATEVRQKETEKISSKVTKMIIIGGKNSSNTKKLYEIALKNCQETICIETYMDLNNYIIEKDDIIGIMAGASTPQSSIDDVVKYIRKEEY